MMRARRHTGTRWEENQDETKKKTTTTEKISVAVQQYL